MWLELEPELAGRSGEDGRWAETFVSDWLGIPGTRWREGFLSPMHGPFGVFL